MEAVRPKKSKSRSAGKPQLSQKQRPAEGGSTAPAAAPDEALCSGFSDIHLSLPYQAPGEPAPADVTETQPSVSSDTALATSQPDSQIIELKTQKTDEERLEETQGQELRAEPESTKTAGPGPQRWIESCLSAKVADSPAVPSAPALALYPSLTSLGEGPLMQLSEEALRSCETRGPAVLALAEQEASPPSLQPLGSVAELPRTRLYPELPQTAPELEAFSLEQLGVWETGGGLRAWLGCVEACAAQFCSAAAQTDGHELAELLQSYWRCRRQLTQSHTQLHTQASDCKSAQNRLWSFRDEQLTLQGLCADQAKVTGYHRFQQADFSAAALSELGRLLETRSELLHQRVVLHAYTALLSRLQVESYLHRLLTDCGGGGSRPGSLQPLKEAVGVLFSFTRRVLDDAPFQTDVHHWLERLVAVLLQLGGTGERLYLLCHLLCCPAGMGKWAANFLQVEVWGENGGVQHFMKALTILMSPARHRAEFLGHMRPCESLTSGGGGPASGNWTLVDEGGEEDEDPGSSWLLLCEEDLMSLLAQFPFKDLYSHMLGISRQGVYEPQACSSQKIMRIFAFASSLIEVLAVGLQTYNRARYRQLVKRIGHSIRMTVCYVSDHWAQYVSVGGVGGSGSSSHSLSMDKLQLEYDHLFLRAVVHVLRNKRLGIWLFMSEMPYGTLSSAMLWRVLYVMQCAETEGPRALDPTENTHACLQALRDPEHQQRFESWLGEVNSSDGIALLTALAHMATPTQHSDPTFINTITLIIYQVSYVSVATRETYSKVGRELLAAIATAHPYVISVVLERLRETVQIVGMDVPSVPVEAAGGGGVCDRGVAVQHPLQAVENRLACVLLEGLHWGHSQTAPLRPLLARPRASTVDVGPAVGRRRNSKYLNRQPYAKRPHLRGPIITASISPSASPPQVSYLASVLRLGVSPEASIQPVAWQMLLEG
ncbi:unnamed protein product [Arctogadus glacialis]